MNLFSEHSNSDTNGNHPTNDTEVEFNDGDDISLPEPHTEIPPVSEEYLISPNSESVIFVKIDDYLSNLRRKLKTCVSKKLKIHRRAWRFECE